MAPAIQKIVLNGARDIAFNKLILSQANVRRIKAGVSVEELAEDIARRKLLQSLNVRPVLDEEGTETGMYEVPAGGRRYRALELLVKQKRLAKTALVPCVVGDASSGTSAEEDSLAENVQRQALHPLDQFRSFKALIDKGLSEEEIAARFFVPVNVVKQRLRLTTISEKLLEVYAAEDMTLEQLTAFSVSSDHARQEQIWDSLSRSYNKEAYYIRRLLTESAVRVSDRRAQFVGLDAYEAAGGVVMRDLFTDDHGGWLQDPALLDRLVDDRLKAEAQTIASEGWKWVSAALDFKYGYANGLRRLVGEPIDMSAEELASYEALKAEFDTLNEQYDSAEELPDEVDERLGELETAIAEFEDRPLRYDPADIARAGVFVSIDADGELEIERGFVRPEDEAAPDADAGTATGGDNPGAGARAPVSQAAITVGGAPTGDGDGVEAEPEEEDTLRPLSERLIIELTAHRTLALREAVGADFDTAFLAVLHVLVLNAFYRYASDTCVEITAKSSGFTAQAPGLKDTPSAKAIGERHEEWQKHLPEKSADLWNALVAFDGDSRQALFAYCASLSVNAVHEPWNRNKDRQAHADHLARAVALDMAAVGWVPTVENYLGRVPKVRILEAVREAKGEQSAQLIDHLKKADMAAEAQRLLADSGWLPEPLRTGDVAVEGPDASAHDAGDEDLPEFLAGDIDADEGATGDPDGELEHLDAAE
ncbi:ParB/RepB/Spo0J family partition protein [Xanthobacter sp. VTT E-85241]|uniref:ParB/RepB/Spo0J family partition protein n=1 Tax=Xanthobacteraceae TaxID=335928 RepID=UPI0037261D84